MQRGRETTDGATLPQAESSSYDNCHNPKTVRSDGKFGPEEKTKVAAGEDCPGEMKNLTSHFALLTSRPATPAG